jgi:hypothetical protein
VAAAFVSFGVEGVRVLCAAVVAIVSLHGAPALLRWGPAAVQWVPPRLRAKHAGGHGGHLVSTRVTRALHHGRSRSLGGWSYRSS